MPPLDPVQAEFIHLYPPDVYWRMTPDAQAFAWANVIQAKRLETQRVRASQRMVNSLVIIFVLVPLIIGFLWFIVTGVTGNLTAI